MVERQQSWQKDWIGSVETHSRSLPWLEIQFSVHPLLFEAFLLTQATFLTYHFPFTVHYLRIFCLTVS